MTRHKLLIAGILMAAGAALPLASAGAVTHQVLPGSSGNTIQFTVQNLSADFPIYGPRAVPVAIPGFVINVPNEVYGTPTVVPPLGAFEIAFQFGVATGTAGLTDSLKVAILTSYEDTLIRSFALEVTDCDCPCHADPACDGVTNVLDVVKAVNVAFRGEPPLFDPACPYEQTDVDCSGFTNVIDVVKSVNVAFRGEDPATQFCDGCAP